MIEREGYTRKAYTREDGTVVEASRVPKSSFCIPDPGRPGRRTRGSGKGPYAKDEPWIEDDGSLGGPGYTKKAAAERHRILDSCVKREGYRSCLGKIMVLLRSTELKATTRKKLMADKSYLKKKHGGPGSFGPRSNPPRKELVPLTITGDVDPFTYGGGVFYYDTEYDEGVWFWWDEPEEEELEDASYKVYSFRIAPDDPDLFKGDLSWARNDVASIASSMGMTRGDLRMLARGDLFQKREAADIVQGHWGPDNLDGYPAEYSHAELSKVFGEDVDRIGRYDFKQATKAYQDARGRR